MKPYSKKTKQTNTSTNRHTNVQNSYAFQKTEHEQIVDSNIEALHSNFRLLIGYRKAGLCIRLSTLFDAHT